MNYSEVWVVVFCAGCKVDADCKWNNEKCDQEDHICRPICTDHEDCISIPCNTDKGVCDPSKILYLIAKIWLNKY